MQPSETAHPTVGAARRTVGAARRTAYVVKVYPRFSETFIVTEILAREAAGESLEIFALRPTTDTRFHPEIARVQAPVHFIAKPYKLADAWQVFARATAAIPGFAERYAALLPELAGYDAADVYQAVDLACSVAERGITHLHAHFGSLAGQTAEIAALLAGIEYSVTTHAKDLFHESVDPARLGRTVARAHHIVTISEYNRALLHRDHPDSAGHIHLVYNGLELDRFPFTAPEPLSVTAVRPLRVAAVGRMVEKKGFFDLVAAVGRLRERGVPVTVRIAGEGELFTAVQTAVAEAGLSDSITLLGARTQEEIRALLGWADVFAAPSIVGADGNADGLPTVLLEAMASGVPCVASTVTGIPEAVVDGVTGLLHAPGDVDGLVTGGVVGDGHEHRRRHTAARLDHPVAPDEPRHQTRHAERHADAGEGPLPRRGERVVAAAGGHGAERLVPDELRLVDRAGVVVEAAGDLELRDDDTGLLPVRGIEQPAQRFEALVEQRVGHAERTHLLGERPRRALDPGELEEPALLGLVGAGLCGEEVPDLRRPDLVELVDAAEHRRDVGEADAAGEALDELAVVRQDPHPGHSELGELAERLGHDEGHLDLEVLGQRVLGDDVDVGLDELAVAPVLGPLAAPHRLDLVALEGERQPAGVLHDVAGEGHSEVEVETERILRVPGLGVEPGHREHLLVDLPVLGERGDRLDGAGVEGGEAVELEGVLEQVDDPLLDDAVSGQPFGEPRESCGLGHG